MDPGVVFAVVFVVVFIGLRLLGRSVRSAVLELEGKKGQIGDWLKEYGYGMYIVRCSPLPRYGIAQLEKPEATVRRSVGALAFLHKLKKAANHEVNGICEETQKELDRFYEQLTKR